MCHGSIKKQYLNAFKTIIIYYKVQRQCHSKKYDIYIIIVYYYC